MGISTEKTEDMIWTLLNKASLIKQGPSENHPLQQITKVAWLKVLFISDTAGGPNYHCVRGVPLPIAILSKCMGSLNFPYYVRKFTVLMFTSSFSCSCHSVLMADFGGVWM